MDASVVFGDDTDVVLDDALPEILPSLMCLLIGTLGAIEYISAGKVGTEHLGDFGPSHEFVDGEEFEELGFQGHLSVAGVSLDAVQEVGLFVVVGGEDDEIDDALESLGGQ